MKNGLHALMIMLGIALFAIPAFYYGQLPDEIPSHYNGYGEVDDYSEKTMIWFLPILGLVLGAMLWFVFDSLPKEKPNKAANELPSLFKEVFILFILLLFNYISFTTIQVALGFEEGLGRWFLPTIIALIAIILLWSVWKKMGRQSQEN